MEGVQEVLGVFGQARADADGVAEAGFVVVADEDALLEEAGVEFAGRDAFHPAEDEVGLAGVGVEPGDGLQGLVEAVPFLTDALDAILEALQVVQAGQAREGGRDVDVVGLFEFPKGFHEGQGEDAVSQA